MAENTLPIHDSMKLTLIGRMKDGKQASSTELESVIWSVDNPEIADIENGYLIPKKSGAVKVSATIGELSAYVNVMIGTSSLDRINVSQNSIIIPLGTLIVTDTGIPMVKEFSVSQQSLIVQQGTVMTINIG